jgi:hypothetical protein
MNRSSLNLGDSHQLAVGFFNYFRGKTQDNTLSSLWFGKGAQLNKKALEVAMILAA